ncbi:zinc ribbon domain-containing protein [Subtercola sp. YIM 133946]|uniref:zinc ribbon domain-containing protein n=1 Tax=Subtercola sp. YIM 133946 TaxID=3118909 RepID=UPI002F934758
MKAPVSEQRSLLELQAADTRLAQLNHRARSLPQQKRLDELAAQIGGVSHRMAQVNGELEDAQLEISRVESDVEVVAARLARDRGRLETSSSAKDIQGLEHEIASLEKRRSDLEDIELAVMERVDDISARLADVTEELGILTAERDALQTERDAALAEIAHEQKGVQVSRDLIAGGIGDELLALYNRQRERYGIGAALLTRGVSGGSNVKLHESDLAKIRLAEPDDVVLDPDSSCILVRTQESGL